MRTTVIRFVLVLVAAAFSGACADDTEGDTGTPVAATLAEYSITLGQSTIPAGTVTFNVKNNGAMIHEFVVLKTDFTPQALPTKDGLADEEAAGVSAIDEIEDVGIGKTAKLTVKLAAGKYLAICNLDDHFSKGMVAAFTVQ